MAETTPDPRSAQIEASSFEELVRAHGAAISRYAWGFVESAADHADLVQEILIALWQALPRFRGRSSAWTYTFRVTHNRALSFAGRRRRRLSLPIPEDVVDPGPGPDTTTELRARHRYLMAAIRQLPGVQRQAVMLYLEGASPAEIAAVQDITENNASVRLTRARRALRCLLEDGAP